VYVHPVLLGGHGQDYRAFARASWEEWRAPVEDAIRYYVSHGFERIYLVGSSAGGPLILSMLDLESFRSESIRGVAFVDPFIVPKPKMFGYIDGFWGSLIKMWPAHLGQDTRKFRYWYGNYPMSALKELKELLGLTRSRLDKGVVLPNQMPMLILQASDDPVSDVRGASVLLQRVRPFGELQVVDSGYHVFTRKVGQEMESWTEGDDDTQRWAFDELIRFFNLEQVAL
jgi:esterase/lipase